MPTLPIALLLLIHGVPLVQDPIPQRPIMVRGLEPDFSALMLRFDAARVQYDATRVQYDDVRIRKGQAPSPDPDPPHPTRVFLPEFETLARKGSGGAQGWILEALPTVTDDKAERMRLAREFVPMLVEKHADEDSVLHALVGLQAVFADFDESEILGMVQSIASKSTIDEIRGEAMMVEACIRTRGGTTQDPERNQDALDLYRSVLYSAPQTKAGRMASGILLGPIEKRFYEAERKWVDALAAMQAAGKPPEEWPRQPMHEFLQEYKPIAAARNHIAAQWVNKFYPAYEQAERQGIGFGLQFLVSALSDYYLDGSDGPWAALRMDLLTVVYRQWPTEKWIYGSIKGIVGASESLPLSHLEPALKALLEKNKEERVLPLAYFALAQATKMLGDQRSYQRAIELFTKIRTEFPDSDVAVAAESGRADLAAVMPGQRAPGGEALDAFGQKVSVAAYKGRVVLFEIFSFRAPAALAAVPSRAALEKELEGKPFSLVGLNVDTLKPDAFATQAKAAGITWRCAIVSASDPMLAPWEIRNYPTSVLIDKKGIIRARNLPWNEMVALAKSLVDESP